jgi:hypothetical protein
MNKSKIVKFWVIVNEDGPCKGGRAVFTEFKTRKEAQAVRDARHYGEVVRSQKLVISR